MKKKLKKIGAASLSALMLSTVVVPTIAGAQDSYSSNVEESIDDLEIDESVMLELQEADLSSLFSSIGEELHLFDSENDFIPETGTLPVDDGFLLEPTPIRPPLYDTDGAKSAAAKAAAKKAIKELKGIGPKVWNEKMDHYVGKLPISAKAKKIVKKYVQYHVLMEILDVVVDFSGTAQEGIKRQMVKMGCPAWLATIVSRGIVTFLL